MATLLSLIKAACAQSVAFLLGQQSLCKKYAKLRAAYELHPSPSNTEALQRLIGTTSPIEDVFAAMASEFDANHYLGENPDVLSSGIDPTFHYLFWGWKEQRTPSKFFEPGYYAQKIRNLPETAFPLAHYLAFGRPNGIPTNPVGNNLWFRPTAPSDLDWLSAPPALRTEGTRAVVVIPVYKGYDETLTSIFHALSARRDEPYSILIVNDKSPDEKLTSKLRELANNHLFQYHESIVNLGFVKTVNLALQDLTGALDVVLLNSDAYVFPGWFNRLVRHAERDDSVATVTPLSNNATICSYPIYNHDNCRSLELSPHELDEIAGKANAGLDTESPTGVGFCFYIKRAAINQLGLLDAESFKLGYGEENDFCMRARNARMKNVIAGDVFVYHTGSVSFSTIKQENYRQGQINLEKKHPNYSSLVRHHVNADSERTLRRNLDAERLIRVHRGSVVFISHRWSGGIETYLKQYRKVLRSQGTKSITLRVHDLHFASFEDDSETNAIFIPNLSEIDLRSDLNFLKELLAKISPSLVHVNSFAGLDWPFHLRMLELIGSLGYPIKFVGHDYSPISHHYQLIRPDNVFVGKTDLETLRSWNCMRGNANTPDVSDPLDRSTAYSAFFKNGVVVEVPSLATKQIYQASFPSVEIRVVPHDDHLPSTSKATRRARDGSLRVVVVGAIGPHKGSDVLVALAADAKNRALPIEYHLLGYSDDDDRLVLHGVRLWGRYADDVEALRRLDELQPDVCLVPSIWPETFCYTLSIAIKKGIPPIVFNVGAQAERLRGLMLGAILPLELSDRPIQLSEALLALSIDQMWDKSENESDG